MPNQPISVTTAKQMIYAYTQYMTGLGVDMSHQTQSVSFSSAAFLSWANSVAPLMDELRVFYGLYSTGPQENRTTVIFWPYKNGEPALLPEAQMRNGEGEDEEGGKFVEPFNEGSLNP